MLDLATTASKIRSDQRELFKETGTKFLFEKIARVLKSAREHLVATRNDLILRLGLRRSNKTVSFKVGDMVSISIKHFKQTSGNIPGSPPIQKFSPRYFGPVPVVRAVGDNAYELDVSKDPLISQIHPVINVDKLRLIYRSDRYHGREQFVPEPVIIDGKEEYFVDQIINDRYRKAKKRYEYLTVWKGRPLTQASWLDASKFTGSAIHFVEDYLQTHTDDMSDAVLSSFADGVPPDQLEEVRKIMREQDQQDFRDRVTTAAVCSICYRLADRRAKPYTNTHAKQILSSERVSVVAFKHYCSACNVYFSTWPDITRAYAADDVTLTNDMLSLTI
jgi:hypothetical protein